MTDADLLCGARAGDAAAWQLLYARCLPAVWRQACALTRDRHAAEDITSEAMLALVRNLNRLEGDAAGIAAWLRSVVRCKAADHYRHVFRNGDKVTLDDRPPLQDARNCDPTTSMEVDETKRRVQQALDQLPDRQRVVLEWKYFDALRVHEMAIRLGETSRAVESVLYRARKEFRRLFEVNGQQSGEGLLASRPEPDVQRVP